MSVLIKNVEMPETCASCDWSYYVGNGRAMCKNVSMTEKTDIMIKRRADFCPLVEISTPHWIPCSERLPTKSDDYLVSSYDKLVFDLYYSVEYGWDGWWHNRISAWMPLPEPYKGVTK